jgi:hypothetical protein
VKKLRIYVDTSVVGGCMDTEFAEISKRLIAEIARGRFIFLLSATTVRELEAAPENVRRVLESLPPETVEYLALTSEMLSLRDAYVAAGVVGSGSIRDAEHIAVASVTGADLVVSWNFKHIVHFDKIAGYNAVNLMNGYKSVAIFSPREVVKT